MSSCVMFSIILNEEKDPRKPGSLKLWRTQLRRRMNIQDKSGCASVWKYPVLPSLTQNCNLSAIQSFKAKQSPTVVSLKAFFHLVTKGPMFPFSCDLSQQCILQRHWLMVFFKSETGYDWLFLTLSRDTNSIHGPPSTGKWCWEPETKTFLGIRERRTEKASDGHDFSCPTLCKWFWNISLWSHEFTMKKVSWICDIFISWSPCYSWPTC